MNCVVDFPSQKKERIIAFLGLGRTHLLPVTYSFTTLPRLFPNVLFRSFVVTLISKIGLLSCHVLIVSRFGISQLCWISFSLAETFPWRSGLSLSWRWIDLTISIFSTHILFYGFIFHCYQPAFWLLRVIVSIPLQLCSFVILSLLFLSIFFCLFYEFVREEHGCLMT